MSLRYKNDILPDDPGWVPPDSGSYSLQDLATVKDLEKEYGRSKCWPNSIQSSNWVFETFKKFLMENRDYKSQWFGEEEMDRIKKARRPRPAQCRYCVKKWKEKGKNPEQVPRSFYPENIKNDICPDCGNRFENFFPF